MVKIFLQAKGPERAVLITDAISATGMPDGRYQLGPIEVEVKDGKATAGGSLAGSVLTMDRAVRNVTQVLRLELPEAVRAATLNPAKAVGLAAEYGKLAPEWKPPSCLKLCGRCAEDNRRRQRTLDTAVPRGNI